MVSALKPYLRVLRALTLFAQLGVSLAAPPFVCILAARWIMTRYGLDRWVMAIGILLGVGGAIYSLARCIRQMLAIDDAAEQPPTSFNDHK